MSLSEDERHILLALEQDFAASPRLAKAFPRTPPRRRSWPVVAGAVVLGLLLVGGGLACASGVGTAVGTGVGTAVAALGYLLLVSGMHAALTGLRPIRIARRTRRR